MSQEEQDPSDPRSKFQRGVGGKMLQVQRGSSGPGNEEIVEYLRKIYDGDITDSDSYDQKNDGIVSASLNAVLSGEIGSFLCQKLTDALKEDEVDIKIIKTYRNLITVGDISEVDGKEEILKSLNGHAKYMYLCCIFSPLRRSIIYKYIQATYENETIVKEQQIKIVQLQQGIEKVEAKFAVEKSNLESICRTAIEERERAHSLEKQKWELMFNQVATADCSEERKKKKQRVSGKVSVTSDADADMKSSTEERFHLLASDMYLDDMIHSKRSGWD